MIARGSAWRVKLACVAGQRLKPVCRHCPVAVGKRHHRPRNRGFALGEDVDETLAVEPPIMVRRILGSLNGGLSRLTIMLVVTLVGTNLHCACGACSWGDAGSGAYRQDRKAC
jgi:hypothetical protein